MTQRREKKASDWNSIEEEILKMEPAQREFAIAYYERLFRDAKRPDGHLQTFTRMLNDTARSA